MAKGKFRDLPRKRYQNALNVFSLGELQLLMLGLWIIGEENRVDFKLMREYRTLLGQLKYAANTKLHPQQEQEGR